MKALNRIVGARWLGYAFKLRDKRNFSFLLNVLSIYLLLELMLLIKSVLLKMWKKTRSEVTGMNFLGIHSFGAIPKNSREAKGSLEKLLKKKSTFLLTFR